MLRVEFITAKETGAFSNKQELFALLRVNGYYQWYRLEKVAPWLDREEMLNIAETLRNTKKTTKEKKTLEKDDNAKSNKEG